MRDLKASGLRDPLAVIADGAPGLIRAVEDVFPRSIGQRCLAHKMRNLQSKVPEERCREVLPAAVRWLTEFERKQLDTLREELNLHFAARHATPIQPASRSRIYGKSGT